MKAIDPITLQESILCFRQIGERYSVPRGFTPISLSKLGLADLHRGSGCEFVIALLQICRFGTARILRPRTKRRFG